MRLLYACKKVAKATFLSIALIHWSGRKRPSRPFIRVRKRFCKQNRAEIAALKRPHGARRFPIYSLPTANNCDYILGFFDSLRPSLSEGLLRAQKKISTANFLRTLPKKNISV